MMNRHVHTKPSFYSSLCVRLRLRVSQDDAEYLAGYYCKFEFKDDIAIRNYWALSLKREIAIEILSRFLINYCY